MTAATPPKTDLRPAAPDRMVGLSAFTQRRKRESRDQLLAAATELFHGKGYYAVSIDDIAGAAGVSRMTFYRHFGSRAAILMALLERSSAAAMPQLLAIGEQNYTDSATVRAWIAGIFDSDWSHRQILRAIAQAVRMEHEFVDAANDFISRLVDGLGKHIPAFSAQPDGPDRRRWLEGWMLAYEILDQSNQPTLDLGVGADPLVIDILTDRFLAFVRR